jgi:hypothetical protein
LDTETTQSCAYEKGIKTRSNGPFNLTSRRRSNEAASRFKQRSQKIKKVVCETQKQLDRVPMRKEENSGITSPITREREASDIREYKERMTHC